MKYCWQSVNGVRPLNFRLKKELGIKPVEDLISKMGISDEDLENVQDQMTASR